MRRMGLILYKVLPICIFFERKTRKPANVCLLAFFYSHITGEEKTASASLVDHVYSTNRSLYKGRLKMKIVEIQDRNSLLVEQLLDVWESSVKATHLFLSEDEIESIKNYVPQALNEIPHLIIIENERQVPMGFMGIAERHLEMLFISDEERGKGLGKKLLTYGMEQYSINDLAVNEQNPLAKGFYEHMGFKVYKRTDYDEQGNPYPLLYMSR